MSISNSGGNNIFSSYQPFHNFVCSVTRWIIPTTRRIRGISPGGNIVADPNTTNKETLNDKNKTDQQ